MTPQQDPNRQAGVPLDGGQSIPAEEVATGDRTGEVRYIPDPDQLVRAEFTHKPPGPLPPEEQNAEADQIMGEQPEPPVNAVAVAPPEPSVWDARPASPEDAGTGPGAEAQPPPDESGG